MEETNRKKKICDIMNTNKNVDTDIALISHAYTKNKINDNVKDKRKKIKIFTYIINPTVEIGCIASTGKSHTSLINTILIQLCF